jgi:hypothetical protein
MRKKKLAKKRHDWFRRRKMNIVSIFDSFTDTEKEVMVKAWGEYYSSIPLALLPFVNRSKMCVAVNDYYIDLSKMSDTDIQLEINILHKLRELK